MSARQPIPLSAQMPFWYALTMVLGANATVSQPLILANDSEFDLYLINATTDQDAQLANNTQGQRPDNFSLSLKDTSTGRDFMSEPIRRSGICGVALLNSTPEGRPIRFPRKEQLQISLTNLVGVQITVQLSLHGYKIFALVPPAAG